MEGTYARSSKEGLLLSGSTEVQDQSISFVSEECDVVEEMFVKKATKLKEQLGDVSKDVDELRELFLMIMQSQSSTLGNGSEAGCSKKDKKLSTTPTSAEERDGDAVVLQVRDELRLLCEKMERIRGLRRNEQYLNQELDSQSHLNCAEAVEKDAPWISNEVTERFPCLFPLSEGATIRLEIGRRLFQYETVMKDSAAIGQPITMEFDDAIQKFESFLEGCQLTSAFEEKLYRDKFRAKLAEIRNSLCMLSSNTEVSIKEGITINVNADICDADAKIQDPVDTEIIMIPIKRVNKRSLSEWSESSYSDWDGNHIPRSHHKKPNPPASIGIHLGRLFTRAAWINPTTHKIELLLDDRIPSKIDVSKFDCRKDPYPTALSLDNLMEMLHAPKAKSCMIEMVVSSLALFLGGVKLKVEQKLGRRPVWMNVALTVPLSYTSVQRRATLDAAKIAGFSEVHLIDEPTAVALDYAWSPDGTLAFHKHGSLIVVKVFNDGTYPDSFWESAAYFFQAGILGMKDNCGFIIGKSTKKVEKDRIGAVLIFEEYRKMTHGRKNEFTIPGNVIEVTCDPTSAAEGAARFAYVVRSHGGMPRRKILWDRSAYPFYVNRMSAVERNLVLPGEKLVPLSKFFISAKGNRFVVKEPIGVRCQWWSYFHTPSGSPLKWSTLGTVCVQKRFDLNDEPMLRLRFNSEGILDEKTLQIQLKNGELVDLVWKSPRELSEERKMQLGVEINAILHG
jgi:hypothetical protein